MTITKHGESLWEKAVEALGKIAERVVILDKLMIFAIITCEIISFFCVLGGIDMLISNVWCVIVSAAY